MTTENKNKFHYDTVMGNDQLLEISRFENGKKLSVIFEAFSEAQVRLFQKVSGNDSLPTVNNRKIGM